MKCKFEHDGDCCNSGAAQYMCKCKQPCDTVFPVTNGDRIRAMSDEELAKVINAFSAYFESCNRSADEVDCKDCELYKLCTIFEGQAMDWLKKPVEDTPC